MTNKTAALRYARALLDRVNPYTKTRYPAEPAVAVVELTNEDTLLTLFGTQKMLS